MTTQEEIRKIWEEIKELKRYQTTKMQRSIDREKELFKKYKDTETLFGHESSLSKAVIYWLNSTKGE